MITLLLLVRASYLYGVVLHAHLVRGESHNQRNTTGEVATLQSLKIIIWYKKLSFGMTSCSYFDKVFSERFERNFNSQFFRYRSWFEVCLYMNIGDGGGAPLKI